MRNDRLRTRQPDHDHTFVAGALHAAGAFEQEAVLTTRTWNLRFHPTPDAGAPGTRRPAPAIGPLARWCVAFFTGPPYHRMGAFDMARSSLARELLARKR